MGLYCGFDFGTSNTVVTILGDSTNGQKVFADSSVLFLPDCGLYAQKRFVGQRAVDEYVDSGMDGRFIQSIKSVLPDSAFTHTRIYEKKYMPEELVSMILSEFKSRVEEFIAVEATGAVFGRPVRFSEDDENDGLAQARLRTAAERCGFSTIEFVYEPVAAAVRYQSSLEPGAIALVCDLGGGTADFSVIHLNDSSEMEILASHGVRVGGDDLDGEIMWHRLAPYFGYGTEYESYDKMLPVPVHIYRTICRWDRIPFLKTTKYHEDLVYIRNGAADKPAIERLISLIEDDLAFAFFQAIREAKHRLSDEESAAVSFFQRAIELKERIFTHEFEEYIQEELDALEQAVIDALRAAGVTADSVGTVFLTGGTSAVRAVQNRIGMMFPEADIRHDTERFNSVSLGLAMEARRLGLTVNRETE
jgi:hypothetical chaperone protein